VTTAVVVPQTDEERRAFIQSAATRFYRRKVVYSWLFIGFSVLMLGIAFVPLGSIVYNVVVRGAKVVDWTFLTTPQQQPTLFHQSDYGGISNAIVGTIVIFVTGLVIAIPVSIALAVALYESSSKIVHGLRVYLEVMIGLPSILFGIFVYARIIQQLGYSLNGYMGAIALALMMLPLMTIAGERALRETPTTLIEAALALGAKRSRVMWRVVLPYSLPRMWTGIMLSLSRAVGETAPILFVIGASLVVNWNPSAQQSAMPTLIWNNLGSQYKPVQESSWGIALVLIVAVFIFNLASKLLVARSNRGRN
jgi:phosphate transport system permease protein